MAPNLQETCDGLDNNCQNGVDEDAVDAATFYLDDDSDGFGDPNQTVLGCEGGGNYVNNDNDCNDDPANSGFISNPDALEICDEIDNDCDGDVDENFKTDAKYASLEYCGDCSTSCPTEIDNAISFCDDTSATPICDYSCDDGFVDLNGDIIDGCECVFLSTADIPFDGIDANCDGEDGDHSLAVHVSASVGDDSFDGSLNFPVATIEQAISLAQDFNKSYVLVAGGTYAENIDLIEGVIYYGSMSES